MFAAPTEIHHPWIELAWLAQPQLPADELWGLEQRMREFDRHGEDLEVIDRALGQAIVDDPRVRRLLAISDTNVTLAIRLTQPARGWGVSLLKQLLNVSEFSYGVVFDSLIPYGLRMVPSVDRAEMGQAFHAPALVITAWSERAANRSRMAVPEAQLTRPYRASGRSLSFEAPQSLSNPDQYTDNPDEPSPTVGGSVVSYLYKPVSVDVSEVKQRSDVVTFVSLPLECDLDVVGSLQLIQYVSSSAVDTDFSGRLSDRSRMAEQSNFKAVLFAHVIAVRRVMADASFSIFQPTVVQVLVKELRDDGAGLSRFRQVHFYEKVVTHPFPELELRIDAGRHQWPMGKDRFAEHNVPGSRDDQGRREFLQHLHWSRRPCQWIVRTDIAKVGIRCFPGSIMDLSRRLWGRTWYVQHALDVPRVSHTLIDTGTEDSDRAWPWQSLVLDPRDGARS